MRDNPLVMLLSLMLSARSGVYFHPKFLISQITGNSNEKSLFLISCRLLLNPELYILLNNSNHLNDVMIDLRENILVTCEVCYIGDRVFSIMDTFTAELTNTVIAKTVVTCGVIDTKKRKMVNLRSFANSKVQHMPHNIRPENIDITNIDCNKSLDSVVSESFPISNEHIDTNKHANALVYVTAALKAILNNKVAHGGYRVREFFILHLNEINLGDHMKAVAWKDESSEQSYCKIFKKSDILSAFARATFYEHETKSKI